MKIVALFLSLAVAVIPGCESIIYIKDEPRVPQKYVLMSKLLNMVNDPGLRREMPRVQMYCIDEWPEKILCTHKGVHYKIKLANDTLHDRKEMENIIRSVYENVELRNDEKCLLPMAVSQLRHGRAENIHHIKHKAWLTDVKEENVVTEFATAFPRFVSVLPNSGFSPIVIVLPEKSANESTTYLPYPLLQTCPPTERPARPVDPDQFMVVECDPNDFGTVMPCSMMNMDVVRARESQRLQKVNRKVYACRWQAKRDAQPKVVVFVVKSSGQFWRADYANFAKCTSKSPIPPGLNFYYRGGDIPFKHPLPNRINKVM